MLRAELVDEAAASIGPTAWSVPIARCLTSTVHIASASDFVQSADGVNGVLTVRVVMGAVLIELPTIGAGVSLLGVQIELSQQVSFVDGSESVTRVALVLPIEFGQSFDNEVGPFAALAALIEGTTTEQNNPTIYPWPEVPAPYYLDCTGVTAPGGGLGCLCDCWRAWNTHREDTDYDFGAWVNACGLGLAATAVLCGAACILTVPTGGGAAPACILCLKWVGGPSIGCLITLITGYTGSILNDRNHRIECIEGCGLPETWEDIEPIKGIDE